MHQRTRHCGIVTAITALMTVLATGGCSRTIVADPLTRGHEPGSLSHEMEFWSALQERPAVSNDEGLHGLILMEAGGDPYRTYAGRVAYAKERDWLAPDFDEDSQLAMQRGTLARAVLVICRIKGGVMLRTLGPSGRYALRELAYEGIMAGGSPQQTVTGPEYIGVVSKAQDFMLRYGIEPAAAHER